MAWAIVWEHRHSMKKPVSLQQQLIRVCMVSSILAGMIALIIMMAVSLYQTNNVHDQIMDEVADILLLDDVRQNVQVHELAEEFELIFALKQRKATILATSQRLALTSSSEGWFWKLEQGKIWRVYTEHEQDLNVYVAQPIEQRFGQLIQSYFGYLCALLLLWLIQWGILTWAMKKHFKKIQHVTEQIAQKGVKNLAPLQFEQPIWRELEPIVKQTNQLLNRLEHALVAEQRFTADASHELRSPISAMQMRLQVLQRQYQDQPEFISALAPIREDLHRSTQILESLLLLARLDPSSSHHIPMKMVNLTSLCENVLDSFKDRIEQKQIELDCSLEDVTLWASDDLLSIFIRNIVDNAIRYANLKGRVWISLDQARLLIEDDGTTLDDASLSRLGERFYRVLGTNTQGSGLGISICKRIIELHEGQLLLTRSRYGGLQVEFIFK